jgi:citronellol/citronellal dehydrogenase
MMKQSRRPEIMGDAAHAILCKPAREFTGNFCIDDLVLYEAGVRDFSCYAAVPGATRFLPDFFVPADTPPLPA